MYQLLANEGYGIPTETEAVPLGHFGPTQRDHISTDLIYPPKPKTLLCELTFEVENWLFGVQKVQIHFGPLIVMIYCTRVNLHNHELPYQNDIFY